MGFVLREAAYLVASKSSRVKGMWMGKKPQEIDQIGVHVSIVLYFTCIWIQIPYC